MSLKVVVGVVVGAGVGVAAVAAAPFTGGGSIAGAIALGEALTVGGAVAGAVGGAVGGGVVGTVASENDKNKIKNAKEEGRQEAKAKNALDISDLKESLKIYSEKMSVANAYFEKLIVMETVAVAVIAYNGLDTRSMQNEISDLLRSISNDSLPQKIQNEINYIYSNPPTIKEALVLAKNTNLEKDLCRDIIMLTAKSFNINHEKYLNSWQQYS